MIKQMIVAEDSVPLFSKLSVVCYILWPRGELDSQEVAIKVFGDGEEAAWRNEWTIYVLLRIQHSNILFFRGARENFSSPMTERYLVTQYHSNVSH